MIFSTHEDTSRVQALLFIRQMAAILPEAVKNMAMKVRNMTCPAALFAQLVGCHF